MTKKNLAPKDKLAADLRVVIADAEELLKATAAQQGEKINDLRARVEGSLNSAKAWVTELEQAAAEKAKETAKAADRYVHQNPWQAIGIAAGIGFIIGALTRRK